MATVAPEARGEVAQHSAVFTGQDVQGQADKIGQNGPHSQ